MNKKQQLLQLIIGVINKNAPDSEIYIISPLIYTKKDWGINRSITTLYENIKKEGVRLK